MNTLKTARLWLAGLALGTLAALLIAPQTRWMVRDQTVGLLTKNEGVSPRLSVATSIATRHPDDFQVQLAAAVAQSDEPTDGQTVELRDARQAARLLRVRSLTARFPNNPSLDAALLRNSYIIRVPMDESFYTKGQKPNGPIENKPPTPEQLAIFDNDAATGERLDPDNAYFPLFRTVGLFLAHRDSDALAALHRASTKNRWEEYVPDEIRGDWRLAEENSDGKSAMGRELIMANVLFWQYASLRSAARSAFHQAVQDENAGHFQDGWVIRQDLLRCASLMRVQSKFVIGALVASALTSIAVSQPSSVPVKGQHRVTEQEQQQRFAKFCTDLQNHGLGGNVPAIRSEVEANKQVHVIISHAFDKNYPRPFQALWAWWAIDAMTLFNAICLLILWRGAGLLARSRRIQAGERMPRTTFCAIAAGVFTAAIIPFYCGVLGLPAHPKATSFGEFDLYVYGFITMAAIAVLLYTAFISRRNSVWHSVRTFVITLVVMSALGTASHYASQSALTLNGDFGDLEDTTGANGIAAIPGILTVFPCVLAASLLLVLFGGIISLVRRIPLSVGLTRTFQHTAIPLACILLFVYSGLIVGTLRQERQVQYRLEQTIQHEGQYEASRLGMTWPGPTNWDATPAPPLANAQARLP